MKNSSPIAEYEPGITYSFEFPEIKYNTNPIGMLYPPIFEYEITLHVNITFEKIQQLFGEKFMEVIHEKYFNVEYEKYAMSHVMPFFLMREARIAQDADDDPYIEMTFMTMNGRNLAVQDPQHVLDTLHVEARKELDKLTFYAIEKDLCQEPKHRRSRRIQS